MMPPAMASRDAVQRGGVADADEGQGKWRKRFVVPAKCWRRRRLACTIVYQILVAGTFPVSKK